MGLWRCLTISLGVTWVDGQPEYPANQRGTQYCYQAFAEALLAMPTCGAQIDSLTIATPPSYCNFLQTSGKLEPRS